MWLCLPRGLTHLPTPRPHRRQQGRGSVIPRGSSQPLPLRFLWTPSVAFLAPSLPSLLPRSTKGPELTTPFTEGASITEGQEGQKGQRCWLEVRREEGRAAMRKPAGWERFRKKADRQCPLRDDGKSWSLPEGS